MKSKKMIRCEISKDKTEVIANGSLSEITTDVFSLIVAVREGLSEEVKKAYMGTLQIMLSGMESGKLEVLEKILEGV